MCRQISYFMLLLTSMEKFRAGFGKTKLIRPLVAFMLVGPVFSGAETTEDISGNHVNYYLENTASCGDYSGVVDFKDGLSLGQIDSVCRALSKYGPLIGSDYSISFKSVDDGSDIGATVKNAENAIEFSYPFERGEEVDASLLETMVLHETVHTLYLSLDPDSAPVEYVNQAYKNLMRVSPVAINEVDKSNLSKLWLCITESSYVSEEEGLGDSFGHPWFSDQEMIASIVTILSLYPAEFMKTFSQLNKEEQVALKRAIEASILAVLTANSDSYEVMPGLASVASQLDLFENNNESLSS